MYIIAVYCWARTLKIRLQRHQATPHSPGPPQGAERSHPRAPPSRGGGGGGAKKKKNWGGGGVIFFFFWRPPPPSRARERAELSDENTGPSSSTVPTETNRNRQETKDLDSDPISAHPTCEILQVVSTNKANKARYGQRNKGRVCATHRKLGPAVCYFLYIYIYMT